MGRKNFYRKNNSEVFQQTNNREVILFNKHVNELMDIVISRFEWLNIPDNDLTSSIIEHMLLRKGDICAFKIGETFIMSPYVGNGQLNIYGKFTSVEPYALNGKQFGMFLNTDEHVKIFDKQNINTYATYELVQIYARVLTQIDMIRDVNLGWQKNPPIFSAPQERVQDMLQMWKNIDNNEPVIFKIDTMAGEDVKIQSLSSDIPLKSIDLLYTKQMIKNEFLTLIGINNNGLEKKERKVADEVDIESEEVRLHRLSFLRSREEACKQINEMFGYNIKVQYNKEIMGDINDNNNDDNDNIDNTIL